MPVITRLVQGKKNPSRINLYLDGVFAFALSLDEVAKNSIKKDLVLSDEQISDLRATDETDYIYAKLLNFLSYRPRTIKEIRDRLYQYDVKDHGQQNALIDKLKSRGYLDDLAFARWFILSRNTHRPRSPRLLTQELKVKGVSAEIIQLVLGDIAYERITIKRLLTKKLGSKHKLDLPSRQKIYGFLSRQGFSWEAIQEVVKNWESE